MNVNLIHNGLTVNGYLTSIFIYRTFIYMQPTQITFVLPGPQLDQIEEMARVERRARSNMVRVLLDEALAARKAAAPEGKE